MTVENTNNTTSYTGNGSVTTFAYNFLTYSADHIFIYFDDVLQSSGFTITGVGDDNGGDIIFVSPPDNGVTIRIDRTVPDTQLLEYQEYGPFPAKANERGLDLLTMAVQQNARELSRTSQELTQNKMDKQVNAESGNIVIFDSNGNSEDSGFNVSEIPGITTDLNKVVPFDNLNQAVSSSNTAKIFNGAALNIREYSTGSGGGAMWDVVLTSNVTPNGIDIVQSAAIPDLSLQLRTKDIYNVKEFGAKGDGSSASLAIRSARGDNNDNAVFFPDGDYPDSRNGEFYLFSNNNSEVRANLGKYRYALGGSLDKVNEARPVVSVDKIMESTKADNPNWKFDAGCLYTHLHKTGGDIFVCGQTSNVRSTGGTGDTIAIHGRAKGLAEGSEVFGGWLYCDIDPVLSGSNKVFEAIGLEINMRNRGDAKPFNIEALPPGSPEGDYRGLNILPADGSESPCNVGVDIGAQKSTAALGWYCGLRLRQDGIVASADYTAVDHPYGQTCQMMVQGTASSLSSNFYGGIAFNLGFFNWGINFEGATFLDKKAIDLQGNFIYNNGVKVLGEQVAAIPDSVGGDESTKINDILAALRNHGLIGT